MGKCSSKVSDAGGNSTLSGTPITATSVPTEKSADKLPPQEGNALPREAAATEAHTPQDTQSEDRALTAVSKISPKQWVAEKAHDLASAGPDDPAVREHAPSRKMRPSEPDPEQSIVPSEDANNESSQDKCTDNAEELTRASLDSADVEGDKSEHEPDAPREETSVKEANEEGDAADGDELFALDQWLTEECQAMRDLSTGCDLVGEDVHPSLRGKPASLCHEWVLTASEFVIKYVDLNGGTLFEWWNEHIAEGETKSGTQEYLARAVAGVKATMPAALREAVEAADEDAICKQSRALQYKNVFGAPSPAIGETDTMPPPNTWITGGGLYGVAPDLPKELMSNDRKYILGSRYSREEIEEAMGRSLEDDEVQGTREYEERQSLEAWLAAQCRSMRYIPRRGHESLSWDEIHPAQKDRSKIVTQCHIWMTGASAAILMSADLAGGTLYDWWNTYIGKGELDTDLSKNTLFNRAAVGLGASIDPSLREAVERGNAEEVEDRHLAVTIHNIFCAPAPPEGTKGCGEDGEDEPEPHSWVAGGDMYAFGPSHITSGIMFKNRKYMVGSSNSREQVERALGRELADDEVEVVVEEDQECTDEDEEG